MTGMTTRDTTATYQYDFLGRRVQKTVNGVVSNYAYDGQDLIRQTEGTEVTDFVFGPGIDEPLAKNSGGVLYYNDIELEQELFKVLCDREK